MTLAASLYAGKVITVLGYGASGRSLAASMRAGGAQVTVWDDSETGRTQAASDGHAILQEAVLLQDTHTLAVSPGIAPKHPLVQQALKKNINLRSDLDVLYEHLPNAHYYGITGTNGKSTTTALLTHLLQAAGFDAHMLGNIGVPALSVIPATAEPHFIIEASSYQLHYSQCIRFRHAALLNITPDHLDWHGTMQAYKDAKRRIFKDVETAVIGVDDTHGQQLFTQHLCGANKVAISGLRVPQGGIGLEGTTFKDSTKASLTNDIIHHDALPRLPGSHNAQNVAAACALALAAGVTHTQLARHLPTFSGLPHRQEFVRRLGGVDYINDSKATNADAAEKAIRCYERLHWIAGGVAKEGGIDALQPYFGRMRHVWLIGQAAEAFAATLQKQATPHTVVGTLEQAVQHAHARAEKGDTVLLSPACASFDQFRNFEQRGDTFRSCVARLPGV